MNLFIGMVRKSQSKKEGCIYLHGGEVKLAKNRS